MAHDETPAMGFRERLLLPASVLFGIAVWARGWCYDAGIFPSVRISVPVISVGNMTAGGTGKTPMVEYLVRLLRPLGKRLAVVSRGYRRVGSGMHVVSDGTTVFGTAQSAGDEPYQIARKYEDVIVIVDEVKSRAARHAVERFGAGIVLVDDGFQHRALARDLDIVLVDSTRRLRGTPFLPSGRRRDVMSALHRAGAVIHTRCADQAHGHEAFPEASGAVVCCARPAPVRFVELATGKEMPLSHFRGARIQAFCGIGDPRSFAATLSQLGCELAGFRTYPDHYAYTRGALVDIAAGAAANGGQRFVTTEKDAMRILSIPDWAAVLPPDTAYLEIQQEFVRNGAQFDALVTAAASRKAA